jgi:signal transduction histidine kinase
MTKKFSEYRTDEVYAVSYVIFYLLLLQIHGVIGASFEINWTLFNEAGVNTFVYTTLIFIILVYCIPAKIARMRRSELEHRIVEERHLADEARVAVKQHTIRYISHEIRTPVSIASVSLSLVLESLRSRNQVEDVELIDMLCDAQHACNASITVLNDMLSYEAMEAGKYKIFPEVVHASTTVTAIANNIKSIGRDKHISLILENRLSESDAESLFLCFDVPKMEQVFRNLASNSVKFSGPGSTIRIIILREESHNFAYSNHYDSLTNNMDYGGPLCIIFEDSGVGIAPENIAKVFGEFNQFDPNKLQGGGGAGLGLHISKNIVTSHFGTIQVRSEGIGHGTYFVMTFASFTRKDDLSVEDLRQVPPPLEPCNSLVQEIYRVSPRGSNSYI